MKEFLKIGLSLIPLAIMACGKTANNSEIHGLRDSEPTNFDADESSASNESSKMIDDLRSIEKNYTGCTVDVEKHTSYIEQYEIIADKLTLIHRELTEKNTDCVIASPFKESIYKIIKVNYYQPLLFDRYEISYQATDASGKPVGIVQKLEAKDLAFGLAVDLENCGVLGGICTKDYISSESELTTYDFSYVRPDYSSPVMTAINIVIANANPSGTYRQCGIYNGSVAQVADVKIDQAANLITKTTYDVLNADCELSSIIFTDVEIFSITSAEMTNDGVLTLAAGRLLDDKLYGRGDLPFELYPVGKSGSNRFSFSKLP